jgi:2-polyprenyl-6-methoxyphenol hydroxylase-like FAD-dependent oxidoreductase
LFRFVFGSGMARDSDASEGSAKRRAIVLGGSIAGLAAARVLADHFEEVLLVERDALDDTDEPRKGVPQGRQLHGLLGRGEAVLEGLFPGLIAGLVEAGAVRVDFGKDVRWHHFGVDKVRFESGVLTTTMTRPFLEHAVRRRLLGRPNVRCLDRCEATGLLTGDDRQHVIGVKIRRRNAGSDEGEPEPLRSELVVDACGRGSPTPRWLAELGRSRPEETEIRVNVCYATRLYHRPEPTGLPYKGLYIIGTPPASKRLGVLGWIEGNRWVALLAGMLGDHPTADPEGFLAFAKGLPVDDMHRILAQSEPASDVSLYKFPSHLRRHYERMDGFPEGLVVLGDSHCSFNPIYGQGMTTAGLGAVLLGECVQEQRRRGGGSLLGLSRRFQARLAKETDVPWAMATSEDFRYPEIEAKRPFGYGFMKWYTGRVHRAVAHDTELALHFLRAMHMLEPPTVLLAPRMALRVLAGGLSR